MKRIIVLFIVILATSCNQNSIDKKVVVGIIPYKGIDNDKVALVKKSIEDYYGVKAQILSSAVLPKAAYINLKSPRYRADSIIRFQNRNIPDNVNYVLGLTNKDISVSKRDNFGNIKKPVSRYNDFGIMGLAYCPGKSCIVSDFRLRHKNKATEFERFNKVAIHELGHNFGLPHCPDKKCVMTDAVERIATIDNSKPELCMKCKNRIKL